MKNRMFVIIVILAISIILLQFPKVETQTIQQEEFSNLKLNISTDKQEYFLLEPIPITFEVSNPTSSIIMGHTSFNLRSNRTALLIRKDNGEEERFIGFSPRPKQIGIIPRPIKPGETHHVEELLDYRLSEMFPTPGEYQIQAIFYNEDKQKAFSNTITIEILAPEGLNKNAYDFINQSSIAGMFFTGSSRLKEQEKVWKRFLLNYSETVYTDYVTFILGEQLFSGGKFEEAEILLQKLTSKTKFVFSEKVKDYLLKIDQKQ